MSRPKLEFDRIPIVVRHDETAGYGETYGFSSRQGVVVLEGQRLVPRARPSATVLMFMHPISMLNLLPFPAGLARAGLHVMCCGSRYPRNDSALIMERVLLDLGAYVRFAKEECGYEKVVLAGWSGGGALMMYYQAEAETPSVGETPAGDPIDIAGAGLIPADAMLFTAAHVSRARLLSEWLDPSVTDETDPESRDAEFDIYDPANVNRPPYDPDFVARFRERQIARNRRITAWVRETLEGLRSRGSDEIERGFVVHRTMADPRWLDPAIDPNEREPGRCYMGDPREVNTGPAGLARFCTLRSWLSQWSHDDSRADAERQAARVSVPMLLTENGADDAVPAWHTRAVFEAAASADKEMNVIPGATHYYLNQPDKLGEAVDLARGWLEARGLAG